jgi:hypothetical protein
MLKIKLPIKRKKDRDMIAAFGNFLYRSVVPMICGMYCVFLAMTGHQIAATIILLPALFPFVYDVVIE